MRDYMLVLHPRKDAGPAGRFESMVDQAIGVARIAFPAVQWQADFQLGPRDHVEVVRAPSEAVARQVCTLLSAVAGVSAEVTRMTSSW